MTLYTTALWFYAVMVSLVFGGGMYESFVIHPAWSRNPPESLVGFVRLSGDPGPFWAPATPLYVLSGLGALAVALSAGRRDVPLILSVVCTISALAWTLVYFRPLIHRLLQEGGPDIPAGRLQSVVRWWIGLNVIRVALVGISWWGALSALATRV